jgi:hypothetical protein
MMRAIVQFILIACGIYLTYNFLVVEKFPTIAQQVGVMSVGLAAGVAAGLMVLSLLFGKRA